MYYLSALKSSLSFTFYFVILCLVLTFWGRHLLALLKVNKDQKSNMMLQLITGIAILLFLCHIIYSYLTNLTFYFIIFFLIGFFGFVIEFYLARLRPWLKINHKLTAILIGLTAKDTWLATMVMALVISMLHSASWPYGVMEGWVNNGVDFHSWIFTAEYKLGLIDPNNPLLSQRFSFSEFDALGTQFLLAFIALAKAQTPFNAAPTIVVTFVVWFGTAVYQLVRQTFKFNFLQSLFISIALCFSSLLNYICIFGMFGHLIFIITFIISLSIINRNDTSFLQFKDYVFTQFFPFFTLFLAYQSGYILFSAYIILFTFILSFISYKINLISRIYKSLYLSFGSFLIISCLCLLVMPGLGYHLLVRTSEVANQAQGWPLAFFNPLLFSGLPFYLSTDQFTTLTPYYQIHIYHYLVLIVITLFFIFFIYKNYKKLNNNIYSFFKINFIFSLVSIFIIAIVFYLSIYSFYGHIYRIWKFSAFIILPLSFLPLCLLIFILINFFKTTIKFVTNIFMISLVIFYLVYIISTNFLLSFNNNYYNTFTNYFFISSINKLVSNYNGYNYLFHLSDPSLYLQIPMLLSKTNNKLFFYPSTTFISNKTFNLDSFNDTLVVITHINYKNIINSTRFPFKYDFNFLHIYDYKLLQQKGFVYIKSNSNNFLWEITNYPIDFIFVIPSNLVNKDVVFSLFLTPEQDFSPPCDRIEFGLPGEDGQINWTQKSINDPNFHIPAELTATGKLEVFSKLTFVKGQRCLFTIDSLDLVPFSNPTSQN
jgi:hypothetical protein